MENPPPTLDTPSPLTDETGPPDTPYSPRAAETGRRLATPYSLLATETVRPLRPALNSTVPARVAKIV
jgi:hypothetical protein